MFRIDSLEIDDHILDKIESKHSVQFEEAEQVCLSDKHHVRKGREGLYKIFGQTFAGRYLLVVLVYKGDGHWKIVTAREMIDEERKLFKKVSGEL